MHLAPPPDFRKNYVMYTQLIDSDSVFLEKETMECIHNTVHFIKKFLNLQFILKTFKIVNKIFETSSIF